MSFSGVVKLADLDDYIAPSQACIKPLMKGVGGTDAEAEADTGAGAKARAGAGAALEESAGGPAVKVQLDLEDAAAAAAAAAAVAPPPGAHFGQMKFDQTRQKASITLEDCLACSGCVTSAETVLITQQSTEEFLESFQRTPTGRPQGYVHCVTVSPQSRAALAVHFGLSLAQTAGKLVTLFKRLLGVDYVFDAAFAQDIALLEARQEFVERLGSGSALPVLASECPGWVCFAEKKDGDALLPHMSTAMSPQQVTGALVKRWMAETVLYLEPHHVYHATVMPCYDKKLEGARSDFADSVSGTRGVDCVLATSEVLALIESHCKEEDFTMLEEMPLDSLLPGDAQQQQQQQQQAENRLYIAPSSGASGGYAANVFSYAAKVLHGVDIAPEDVDFQPPRRQNKDLKEATLTVDGQVVLRFALAYGFRNIQNIVRKIKNGDSAASGGCEYHYVEIMACPSGCLNGGGQIRPELEVDTPKARKSYLRQVETAFHDPEQISVRVPEDNPGLARLYKEWIGGGPYSKEARACLHTTFHPVAQDDANPLAIKW